MRRFLGGVLAGAAGVLLLGRWLKERRVLSERRQAWRRVRNVWSPVVYPIPVLGKEPRMQATSPSSSSKNTLDTGGGDVSVGVDETPEVRVETGVRLRSDGVVKVLWSDVADKRRPVILTDFEIGGLKCDEVIFDDPLGPTGSACGDDPGEWPVWHAETLRWGPVVERVINMLAGGHPSERLLRYAVDEINNELVREVCDVGDER